MKIFVFKTNIVEERQKEVIKSVLSKVNGIIRWSVNMEDQNKAIRVEGHGLKPEKIKEAISKAGFKCELMY